ncbi:MAG: peptide deformylase [Candidatus Hodgkinia cicadicola]
MSLVQTKLAQLSFDRTFDTEYGLLFWPNPMLRLPAIHTFMEFNVLLWTRMVTTLLAFNALGINSVQVGWPEGLMITHIFDTFTNMQLFTMLGEVTPYGAISTSVEECLSLPNLKQVVIRRECAIVIGYTAGGGLCAINATYPSAICWQHEGDHSFGILTLDSSIKHLLSPPKPKLLLAPPANVK